MLKYCIFSKQHVSFEVLISSFSNFFDFEIVRFFQESLLNVMTEHLDKNPFCAMYLQFIIILGCLKNEYIYQSFYIFNTDHLCVHLLKIHSALTSVQYVLLKLL